MNNNIKIIKKAGAIITNNEGKILIFQEKFSNTKYLWNIVKGTYNENIDKTLGNCLKREIFEETNIQHFTLENVLNITEKYYTDKISLLIVFIVSINPENEYISNKNAETNESIQNYTWINKDDFLQFQESDFVDKRIYQTISQYFSQK